MVCSIVHLCLQSFTCNLVAGLARCNWSFYYEGVPTFAVVVCSCKAGARGGGPHGGCGWKWVLASATITFTCTVTTLSLHCYLYCWYIHPHQRLLTLLHAYDATAGHTSGRDAFQLEPPFSESVYAMLLLAMPIFNALTGGKAVRAFLLFLHVNCDYPVATMSAAFDAVNIAAHPQGSHWRGG